MALLCALVVACSAEDSPVVPPDEPSEEISPGQLAVLMGSDRYVGQAVVADSVEEGDVTTWSFTEAGRTGCLRGDPFVMATRDSGSEDLLIFLQGGGACWDGFCLAVTSAASGIPKVDILNPDLEENPLADWNAVYLPYCDGSMFAGDRDHDDDGDGEDDRMYRGLANLTAALDIAQTEFPNPKRVVFAGSSGGGFGAILNTPLVRHYYPDADLFVVADGAVGVARGDVEPGMVTDLMDQFGAHAMLPDDCHDCIAGGHLVPVVDWYLKRDPNVRFAVFSSWYDMIVGDVFLDIPPDKFRDFILATTDAVHAAHPERYRRFIVDGRAHTVLLGNASGIIGDDIGAVELPDGILPKLMSIKIGSLTSTQIGDLYFSDWLRAMVDGDSEGWPDTLEDPGPVPE